MDEQLVKMKKNQARALDPQKALKLLKETCVASNLEVLALRRIERVKCRPGRRLTVRYEVEARRQYENPGSRNLFGKLYRGGHRGKRSYEMLRFLRHSAPKMLIFPEPLGYNMRRRFLLMDGIEGPSLTELLGEPLAALHVERVANGVSALHALDPDNRCVVQGGDPLWRVHDAAAEGEVLARALASVSESALPAPVKAGFHEVHAVVQDNLARGGTNSWCVIHRDLYPDQVILCNGRVGFVDVDEICLGEAELDVGNFIAHLQLADLQRQGAQGSAAVLTEAFRSAYAVIRPLSESRLASYQAACLLRLASLPRVSRPEVSILDWDRLAAALIDLAHGALLHLASS